MRNLKVLVFAGAGASFAVNADKYPTTLRFFERLPKSVRTDQCFLRACEFIKADRAALGQVGSDTIDIEDVLFVMQDVAREASGISRGRSALGWLIQSDRYASLVSHYHGRSGPIAEVAHAIAQRSEAMFQHISRMVFETYKDDPAPEEIESNWLSLLTAIGNHRVEVFTTNYDTVIESAIDGAGDITLRDGVSRTRSRILDCSLWSQGTPFDHQSGRGLVTKLHGSTQWVKVGAEIRVGASKWTGKDEDHVLIYPGYKGAPIESPFMAFHSYLEAAARTADIVVFIGFAFRDAFINDLLRNALASRRELRNQTPLTTVTVNIGKQDPTPNSIRSEMHHYLDRGFNHESVAALFDILRGA